MDWEALRRHRKIFDLYLKEKLRQDLVLNLIPSENYVSKGVLEALASEFTNKYAEGEPYSRYYFGNEVADELEDYAKKLALRIFGLSGKKWVANVQSYSGSPANFAVYSALLAPGDKILGMSLAHGGHLTHGHKASTTGKLWKFEHYGVDKNGFLDYGEILKIARRFRPKLIVAGASAYSRKIDFKKFGAVAKSVKAILMADISHVAGLVVAGVHPSPFPAADIVTTTTHKTLRGPRAAVIFSRLELAQKINRAVFPGLQGGPHLNTIGAMAVAFEEALTPSFRAYGRQIVKNARVLAEELSKEGFKIVSGGTDNHLMLIDVTPLGWTGESAGSALARAGIVVNKNAIPFDEKSPRDPSGIRLGTPAVTTRGMKEREMKKIAGFVAAVLLKEKKPADVAEEIRRLTLKFPVF